MSQVWTMKLAESDNIRYISVSVTHAIKVNIKQTFMGDGFLQMFMWW